MKKTLISLFVFCLLAVIVTSCEKEQLQLKLSIQGYSDTQTRTNESGFQDGDQVGIYVVDNVNNVPGVLSTSANHASNVKFTYSATGSIWAPAVGSEIYWNDSKTKIDIYSYHPYSSSVGSVTAYPFSVESDQSSAGNYFKSDFLWAKAANVTSQTSPVNLYFGHKLSKVVLTTSAGDGFSTEEYNSTTKSMQLLGTKLSSTINLSTGVATATGSVGTITPFNSGNTYSAIVVPQTLTTGTSFIKMTVNGVDYIFALGITFESNKQYNISVKVSKNKIEAVINGITAWDVDSGIYEPKKIDIAKDIEGNIYTTVKIGTQTWMKDNLKTTKYRNGDPIGTTTPATLDITNETAPKYQWAYDGNEGYVSTYGRLYTWYVATDSRGICPNGWHVPTDAEWTTLTTYLGGVSIAGVKLKEAGTSHWIISTAATNSSGFTALPGGHRKVEGPFSTIGLDGNWWCFTETNTLTAWMRTMNNGNGVYIYGHLDKAHAYSIRCIRDF